MDVKKMKILYVNYPGLVHDVKSRLFAIICNVMKLYSIWSSYIMIEVEIARILDKQ